MSADRAALHDRAESFFENQGSAWMRLTAGAARDVCARAADRGLIVVRVEGGLWHEPGFEPRSIWDGADPPCSVREARKNNERAMRDIEVEQQTLGAFIITSTPIAGYEHKAVRHAI